MKIVNSRKESGLLLKEFAEQSKWKTKRKKKGGLLLMLLAKLVTTKGKGVIRAGRNFQCRFILQLILKYNNIIKVNLNLMVSI